MKTNKFISPFISCVVQNFPFIEESIDGLTQYELLCKIVEKLNEVITQTNTQTENIEKLEEAFTTLKNYVDNYFNNLDIQTEINNKLDEMATSGELEAIIASYLNTQAVRGFSTLNDLKNATGLITGAICQTSGKNTYKDGLGSLYRIRNITNEDTIDNDKLIAIVNDVSLVAEKITNNIRNTNTTSDTETYSCNYINKITEKNIIYLSLNSSTITTTSANEKQTIQFTSANNLIGNKLSFSANGVKIGDGVSKVMVSLTASISNTTSNATYQALEIYTNSTLKARQEGRNQVNNSTPFSLSNIVLDVNKNDVITGAIFNRVAGTTNANYIYLTVEVIE